jgi:hypothetical protein
MIGCLNNNYNSTGTIGVNHIQIPLQFWFCRNPGLALPLIALQYHEVQLNFVFGSDVGVNAELSVECDYFYLDTDERRRFSQVSHEYLIEQLQVQQLNNVSDHKISFNHPVKELIWTSTTDYGDASLSLNGLERFEKQKKEYFQLRQPYDYHSAIPGYNIPITEKTELLTIPIDTGIKQHNFFPGDGVGNGYQNVISAGSIVHLENDQITFGNNVEALPNSEKFKIGDMISIVISAYQNPVARPKENGIEDNVGGITDPGGVVVDGADGTTENSITTSKSSYHTVSAIVDTTSSDPAVAGTKIVSFTPSINQHPGASLDNRLINNLSAADDLGDHLNVFILGRIQQKEARCSKLAKNINVYSFSLRPEDHQPSGSCNFSRIDTARLITSENLSSDDHIYAVNYNVLRIMSGMGGVAYSN